jgi:hypothetical protein
MPCAICTLHKETRSAGFLVWPLNQGRRFLPIWPQNWWFWVSRFGPQNHHDGFHSFDLKTGSYGLVIWASKLAPPFFGLGLKTKRAMICLDASWAWVSQFDLKTGGGTAWLMHVASWWRSCGDEAEDGRVHVMGCIGLFCPNFVVFIILGPRGILVF